MLGNREYHVYFVDGAGALGLERALQCTNDQIAIEQARRLFAGGTLEVWEGNRLVARGEAPARELT